MMVMMSAMPAVHKNMHKRASKEEKVRRETKQMRAVTFVKEEGEDRDDADCHDTSAREQPAIAVLFIVIV
jgi:hypothetical protein